MATSKVKAKELLFELAFENPAPEEKWFSADCFDPPFGKTELHYAQTRGWIELDKKSDVWRFRLMAGGRVAIATFLLLTP